MTNPEIVAQLAHQYTAAKDMAADLADKPFMAARRLQEATIAQITAEVMVYMTDSGDWRTRARNAKAEREKILFSTSQLVSKGHKAEQAAADPAESHA